MTARDWTSFRLMPDDLLFFRDGKPSTRGDDHYLRSLFPPYPSTLYGAVRTRRLKDEGINLSGLNEATWSRRLNGLAAELGSWGGFGSLRLRGPWLLRGDEPLLPVPADLGIIPAKTEEEEPPRVQAVVRYRPLPESLPDGGSHSQGLSLLGPCGAEGRPWKPSMPGVEPRPAAGWFLTPAGLTAWRSGDLPAPDQLVHASTLWQDETRTGLGLQPNQRISEDGQLYTFGFVRLLAGVSLGFEVAASGLKPDGRLRLGGEGRSVFLAPGPKFPSGACSNVLPLPVGRGPGSGAWDQPGPGEAGSSGRRPLLALTFVTPALSANGAWPPGFSREDLTGQIEGIPFVS